VIEMKNQITAYDQGYKAGQSSMHSRNPYRPGTTDYEMWEEGFVDGQDYVEEEQRNSEY
jgi:hypothetical protein